MTGTFFLIGSAGTGTLEIHSGTLTSSDNFNLAAYRGSTGTVVLSGGLLDSHNNLYIGLGDTSLGTSGETTAEMTVLGTAALNVRSTLFLGTIAGVKGTLNLVGSQGKVKTQNITLGADGTFNFLADNSGVPTINVTGTAMLNAGTLKMGVYGGAAFFHSTDEQMLLSANALQNKIFDESSIWNIRVENNQLLAKLSHDGNVLRQGETYEKVASTSSIAFDPVESGWIVLEGFKGNAQLSLTLNETDGLEDFVYWMNELYAANSSDGDFAVTMADGKLFFQLSLDHEENVFAWDFSDYNAANQTHFAVTGIRTAQVPEPTTGVLLLSAGLFFCILSFRYRGKRKNDKIF